MKQFIKKHNFGLTIIAITFIGVIIGGICKNTPNHIQKAYGQEPPPVVIQAEVIVGENITEAVLSNGSRIATVYSSPRFYQLVGGSWDVINRSVYTRQTPTIEGYRYGIWTDGTIWELPDSLNATLPIKVSDRKGNSFAFKPVGFVRYINGDVDVNNIIKFKKVLDGITVASNVVTYAIGDGSRLELTYTEGKVKQLLQFSQADRTALIKAVPNADYIGIAYEYAKSGTRYKIDVDAGIAWTPDSTLYPVKNITKVYNGKNYWLPGVAWSTFNDTLGQPGVFTIDPTVIDTTTAPTWGKTQTYGHATYQAAREATSGDDQSGAFEVGQNDAAGDDFRVKRSFAKFPISSDWTTIDSAFFGVKLTNNGSTTDFIFNVYSSFFSVVGLAMFDEFHGWQSGLTRYTGDSLVVDGWNSANYTTDWWDKKVVAAGLDTIQAHVNDTLKVVFLSFEDVTASVPVDKESVYSSGGTGPRLIVYYRYGVNDSIKVLSRFDSLQVVITGPDTSNYDSSRVFKVVGTDSLPMTGYFHTFADSVWTDSTFGNTQYILFARLYGADSVSVNTDTVYTRPDIPELSLKNAGEKVIVTVSVGDSNTSETKISIMDSTKTTAIGHRVWLDSTGDTTITERFFNIASWGTITNFYTIGDTARYAIRAQNNDSTFFSTLVYDSVIAASGFDSANFYSIDTNSVYVNYDFDTLAVGKYMWPFVYDPIVTTDTTWGDSVVFASTVTRDTIALPDSVNKKWYGKVLTVDSSDRQYYSDLDSVRTHAVPLLSVTGTDVTDTSFTVVMTASANHSINTGIWGLDSARVAAGSTNTWIDPASEGFQASKAYASVTKWNATTLKFYDGEMSPKGADTKYRFGVDNVDTLGQQ